MPRSAMRPSAGWLLCLALLATPACRHDGIEGAAVHGRVLGLDAEQLAGVHVAANSQVYGSRVATLDRDGSFRVTGLEAGEWWITASLPRFGRGVSRQVELAKPGDETEVELLFEPGYVLRGEVSVDGVPLASGEVDVTCRGSLLHVVVKVADGRFRHDGIPSGTCAVGALDPGRGLRFAPRQVEVDGETDLALDYVTARLTGRVVTGTGREPVAGALVDLEDQAGGGSFPRARTDSDGRFEMTLESGRSWDVRVSIQGFLDLQSSVAVDSRGKDVELAIERFPG
jgi:Carboxypeptidase regulatory-like domain